MRLPCWQSKQQINEDAFGYIVSILSLQKHQILGTAGTDSCGSYLCKVKFDITVGQQFAFLRLDVRGAVSSLQGQ